MESLRRLLGRPRAAAAVGVAVIVAGLLLAAVLGRSLVPAPAAGDPAASGVVGAVAIPGGWRPMGWAPDGDLLLVAAGERLAVVDADGTLRPVEARAASWWAAAPRTLGAIVEERGQDRLVLQGMQSGARRVLLTAERIDALAFSADGMSWAVADGAGVLTGLLRGAPARVADDAAVGLAFDPSGERMALQLAPRPTAASGGLAVLDLDAGERTVLPEAALEAQDVAAWSPAGRFVAFTGRTAAGTGLQLVRGRLTTPATLVLDAADPASVRWSPDGRWLAAARLPAGSPVSEVVALRVRPTGVRPVMLGPGRVTGWRPDASEVLTVDAGGRLVGYRLDGRPARTYATGADPSCRPVWSATSDRLAWCGADGTLRLAVVEE